MPSKKPTNRLIHESSPYLLQHAHNPVDWHPWGKEALDKAKRENKPILVSIGYSSCHWCHVMERESFENEETASIMNQYFINIKVDREERPDLDSIYMEAVQAITNGSGGWPLNCFLLPDGRPFFGGTYFPPQNAYNRTSWSQVLNNIANAFFNNYKEVEKQAESLTRYVERSDRYFLNQLAVDYSPTLGRKTIEQSYEKLKNNFDSTKGGFGHSPKFPSTMALRFCLNYHYYNKDQTALDQLNVSLKAMIFGGIYDQLGGGFARYSVDEEWLVPHFEKMLYDNALLIGLLADAYKHTKNELYRSTIAETTHWLETEMQATEGGFYAALDADSEGSEGKFYVWSEEEFSAQLTEQEQWVKEFYKVSQEGNWEHTNILSRSKTLAEFASEKGLKLALLQKDLASVHNKLLTLRNQRTRPGLDDKVILSWNALLVTAYAKAYQATQDEAYKTRATSTLDFLTRAFRKNGAELYHTYKNSVAKHPAFLDDYANLIQACIEVYQISFDEQYLNQAQNYTQYCLDNFYDTQDPLFYYTCAQQDDILLRKKDLYDNATPAGNSTMLHNLLQLSILLDKAEYRRLAEKSLRVILESVQKFPQTFANWANALYPLVYGYKEIAILGQNYKQVAGEIQQIFLPTALLAAAANTNPRLPLLKDKAVDKDTLIFLCQNYACQNPVREIASLKELL